MTPLPVGESKSVTSGIVRPASVAALTMAAPRGCSEARSTPAASRSSSSLVEPGGRDDRGDRRLAFGEGAGLVDDQGVDLLHQLERLGVLDQDAEAGAAADARP